MVEELGRLVRIAGLAGVGPVERPCVRHPLDDPAGERVVGVKDDPGLVLELLEQRDQPRLVHGDVEQGEFADVHVRIDDHPRHFALNGLADHGIG